VEHAPEFEVGDVLLDLLYINIDALQRGVVRFAARELEQLRGVREPAADALQRVDDRFEPFLFLAEFLRALLVFPELRVFQLAVQRFEASLLGIEVKDTSAAPPTVLAGRRGWRRSG
jgi:hypothetical protein